jgi:hypothetical protein
MARLLGVLAAPVALFAYYRRWLQAKRRRASETSVVVTTAHGPVEYDVRGQGPTILHFHGGNVGHNGWFFLEHLVTAGYRVLTPDRPGYLGTPLADHGRPQAQADVAAAMLDTLGIDRVAVVGLSAGGPPPSSSRRVIGSGPRRSSCSPRSPAAPSSPTTSSTPRSAGSS